jgi:hypothetical protein
MDMVSETRIKGSFSGWGQGNVYVLAEGNVKKWKQVGEKSQFKALFRPKAKLLRDGATFYLAVEGMEDMVEARRER